MTDATTGPGAEGTSREGKPRGNTTVPGAVPDRDRTSGGPVMGGPAPGGSASGGPALGGAPDGPALGGSASGGPALGGSAPGGGSASGDSATGGPPTSDPARVAPRGETARGDIPASGADTGRTAPATGAGIGRSASASGADTPQDREAAQGGGTPLGGETATGRDGALNASGTSGLAGTPDRAGPSHPLGATAREGSGASGREVSRTPAREAPGTPLLPHDESDKLALRLQHAVAGFVDGPRDAVEEADHVLEEAASRFIDAVTQRRRTLRNSWQTTEGGVEGKPATSADTEQLRLALRDYRELAERLLRL